MKEYKDKLTVSKPSLPDLGDYTELLREIWNNRYLTNFGSFHLQLEQALMRYLGCSHLSLFCNGSIALQTGLQALNITGEVITTPFTFPATAHCIHWNRSTPVFCDIDPDTFCMNPAGLEPLISSETAAILPVHVYGTPCDVVGIQSVADEYNLKVFYDAAHAFGIRMPDGESVLEYGDLSMLSFHATKVFNTAEGGALICNDPEMKSRIDSLENFGIADETSVIGPGTNGKMCELLAAFGLLLLQRIDDAIEARRQVDTRYRENLAQVPGIRVPNLPASKAHNYGYFPVLIQEEYALSRDELFHRLKDFDIWARPYFYPLTSEIPCYKDLPSASPENLPVAMAISRQVLCLPIFETLSVEDVDRVCSILQDLGKQ